MLTADRGGFLEQAAPDKKDVREWLESAGSAMPCEGSPRDTGGRCRRSDDPGIPQIGDADEVEGGDAGRLVDLADKRRMVADVARPVAGACAVGDATVERHADEADVDPSKPCGM